MQKAVRDALIAFMAATAQAQAEATKAAQRAGIEHAKAKDGAAYLGRKPSYTRQQFTTVRHMLGQDAVGIARIAKETGLTRQTVYRIKDDPAAAEAGLDFQLACSRRCARPNARSRCSVAFRPSSMLSADRSD
jgi:putative DNA-invertase from lambdoid prophage Rac